MAENSYRNQEEKEEVKSSASRGKSTTIFDLAESRLGLNRILRSGLPIDHLPKVLFGLVLILLYVANTHYADRVVRKTNKLKNEVEDIRADYITLKADLMFKSKQSEVAKRVTVLGLEEPLTPPEKIVITEQDINLETEP